MDVSLNEDRGERHASLPAVVVIRPRSLSVRRLRYRVGRRYRRQDEVGTPFCITVDGQTLQDGTVTVRDRDSLEQKRVHQDQLVAELEARLS